MDLELRQLMETKPEDMLEHQPKAEHHNSVI
jgi:hypothetical protein